MGKRENKAHKNVIHYANRYLGAMQGRALCIHSPVYIYTCRWYLPQPCPASLLLSGSPVPVCALTKLHSLSAPTGFFHSPHPGVGETNENDISLYLPKLGHPTAAVQGAGEKGSHPPQLKRNSKLPNKQTKEYAQSKPTPPSPPPCSEIFTTLKFSILDLGQEVNILFWKN